MIKNKRFVERLGKIPRDVKIFVDDSYDISNRIFNVMKRKGISQRELAKKLGKSEAEISKWKLGTHNFTLRTISKITVALDEKIIEVAGKQQKSQVHFVLMNTTETVKVGTNKNVTANSFDNIIKYGMSKSILCHE